MCYALVPGSVCGIALDGIDFPETRRRVQTVQESRQVISSTPVSLLQLPQELLDIIFNIAYPEIKDVDYVSKSDWDKDEAFHRKRAGEIHTKRPFPYRIDQLLVCKCFFVLAATAYVGDQTWNENSGLAIRYHSLQERRSIFRDLVTKVVIDRYDLRWATKLPNLREVAFQIDHGSFYHLDEDVCEWRHALSDEKLEQAAGGGVFRLQGLRHFELRAEECIYAETQEEEEIWKKNLGRLVILLRKSVLGGSKDVPEGSPQQWRSTTWPYKTRDLRHTRLYTGSAVCFGTSTVSPLGEDTSSSGEIEEDGGELFNETCALFDGLDFKCGEQDRIALEYQAQDDDDHCHCPHCIRGTQNIAWNLRDLIESDDAYYRPFIWTGKQRVLWDLLEAQTTSLPPVDDGELVGLPALMSTAFRWMTITVRMMPSTF